VFFVLFGEVFVVVGSFELVWWDVLVEVEEVCWIVCVFERFQLFVFFGIVCLFDLFFVFFYEEVDIDVGVVWCECGLVAVGLFAFGFEFVCGLVVVVDVECEFGIVVVEGGLGLVYMGDCFFYLLESDVCDWGGDLVFVFDYDVDHFVAEFGDVVGVDVVLVVVLKGSVEYCLVGDVGFRLVEIEDW